jgi:hypothetical protein
MCRAVSAKMLTIGGSEGAPKVSMKAVSGKYGQG